MSKLLLDEQPLLIMRNLAVKIGLNESILLQQIHYWVEINKRSSKNYIDGKYWTYNTYIEWQKQFPFWSISTIQRTIKTLESMHLISFANYNKMQIDKTKWYTINYKVLEALETSRFSHIGISNMSDWNDVLVKLSIAIPKNISKNKAKNNIYMLGEHDAYINKFTELFGRYTGKKHRKVLLTCLDDDLYEYDNEDFINLVIAFFEDKSNNTYEKLTIDYFNAIYHRYR